MSGSSDAEHFFSFLKQLIIDASPRPVISPAGLSEEEGAGDEDGIIYDYARVTPEGDIIGIRNIASQVVSPRVILDT